jgi:alginate O-acetyltransferase complex protein AlgI
MTFNSIPFVLFVLLFFLVWARIKQNNTLKWFWIVLMSSVFYAWWDWRFLIILFATGAIDYYSGNKIIKNPQYKKVWLWVSLGSNILSLVAFKYSAWLAGLFDQLFQTQVAQALPAFTLVVPVGISFYTFNSMSYTIDLYRGKAKTADSLLHFFAFISFFPHLVAGPIIRAKDILGQLSRNATVNYLQILNGVKIIIWGFFQKMVLADNLAVFVNEKFQDVNATSDSLTWWLCMLGFTFQIYFDFNGYSTIARGLAKCCGIHFKLNFNQPYRALSFRSFWQKWHISLSSFFKDYVYKSLGGNKGNKWQTEINKWTTMLVSGIWHGANLTFLFWGAIHAFFLTVESLFKAKFKVKIPSFFSAFVVMLGVVLAWVFFRANTLSDAFYVLEKMLIFNSNIEVKTVLLSNVFIWLVVSLVVVYGPRKVNVFGLQKQVVVQSLFWGLLLLSCIYLRGPEQQFIYFQF